MTEFYTPLNRSRRSTRIIQYCGILMTAVLLVVSLIYMALLTKAFAEVGAWKSILMITPWVPLFCYNMFRLICRILLRPFVRIRLTREGVHLIRPFCKDRLIPWGAFQEICLIDDDLPRRDRQQPATLLMVKWEAPRMRSGEWNDTSTTHADRFISVDFDAEVRAALRELCPHPIVDHRKHINGKHSPTA